MPAPRLPKAKADVSGQTDKNPQRFRQRREPSSEPLGPPSDWMSPEESKAWERFARELPWLTESDRTLVEIAATVRARMMSGTEVGVQALNLLRQCLGQMGATPADRTKVSVPDESDESPEDQYFN